MSDASKPAKQISPNELDDAIRRSGYLLESRTYELLRRRGFYGETNMAYPDPITGKSRELDLYAMSVKSAGPGEFRLSLSLLIECVNSPQPIALFTKQPLADYLEVDQIKLAGLPVKVPEKGQREEWISLRDWLSMDRYHHYCRGRVASQFCSFTKKQGKEAEWMATHLDYPLVETSSTRHGSGRTATAIHRPNVDADFPMGRTPVSLGTVRRRAVAREPALWCQGLPVSAHDSSTLESAQPREL